MKVTPLDLRQQRFSTVMRGFDRGEVTAFLADAAEDYENAMRENDRLRQELSKLEALIKEHRGQEIHLRNTLLTAQKLADDIKETANLDAQRIVRDAEGRADLLLQKAQARLEDVQREIDGLRLKRREVETSLEGIIATIHNTIAYVREQDAVHREEKILLHRPRLADPSGSSGVQITATGAHATHPSSASASSNSAAPAGSAVLSGSIGQPGHLSSAAAHASASPSHTSTAPPSLAAALARLGAAHASQGAAPAPLPLGTAPVPVGVVPPPLGSAPHPTHLTHATHLPHLVSSD